MTFEPSIMKNRSVLSSFTIISLTAFLCSSAGPERFSCPCQVSSGAATEAVSSEREPDNLRRLARCISSAKRLVWIDGDPVSVG